MRPHLFIKEKTARLGAIVTLLLFVCAADSSPADSFPIALVDNRIFVEVQVDGRGPFAFLLDTGSSSVTVEKSLAGRLHLRPVGAGTTDGAGENRVGYSTVHLDSFALGRFALGSMDVPALDNTNLSRAIGFRNFDGVLGADIFRRRIVTIDVPAEKLDVREAFDFHPAQDAIAVPIELNADETPMVAGTINGVRGRFIVDTGDRSSLTLFGPFWRRYAMDREIGPTITAMTGFGLGGPIRAIVGRPANFSLGGIAVPAPVTRLSLQKAGVFTTSDYAGSIGMGVLKRFVVSFDYERGKMWLTKNSGSRAADRYDRSGAWLGLLENGHLIVMDVAEGGPAARAGLRPGDTVLAVGGSPADADHLFQIRDYLKLPGVARADFRIARAGMAPMMIPVDLRDLITSAK